jgi:non-ribosomal peptide synthetase component F
LHQIFVALTTGGTVVIAREDIRGDSERLAELMLAKRVTFTVGVPSEYKVLLRYGHQFLLRYGDWRYAVCGGERMTVALKEEFRTLGDKGPILLSCYGPTEVSLASSFGMISYSDKTLGAAEGDNPVGFTLPNYSVYILDENQSPVLRVLLERSISGASALQADTSTMTN